MSLPAFKVGDRVRIPSRSQVGRFITGTITGFGSGEAVYGQWQWEDTGEKLLGYAKLQNLLPYELTYDLMQQGDKDEDI